HLRPARSAGAGARERARQLARPAAGRALLAAPRPRRERGPRGRDARAGQGLGRRPDQPARGGLAGLVERAPARVEARIVSESTKSSSDAQATAAAGTRGEK